MHAVGAEHVRDLVRVGDDRGRAEREDEPRELVDQQLRRLEVEVRVDEAGDDVAAGRIEGLAALVLAEAGDEAVDDRDVSVEPLAREGREDAAAADHEVGGLVAAGDREPSREPATGDDSGTHRARRCVPASPASAARRSPGR